MKKIESLSPNSEKYTRSHPSEDPEFETKDSKNEFDNLENHRNQEIEQNKHKWDQRTRGTVRFCMILLIMIAATIIGFAMTTLGYHMLTSEDSHWLSEYQISNIKSFFLSGALVSVAIHILNVFLLNPPTYAPRPRIYQAPLKSLTPYNRLHYLRLFGTVWVFLESGSDRQEVECF